MSGKHLSDQQREELIAAWLDGRITPAESERLQDELKKSPEARVDFLKYAEFDVAIRQLADMTTIAPSSGFPDEFSTVRDSCGETSNRNTKDSLDLNGSKSSSAASIRSTVVIGWSNWAVLATALFIVFAYAYYSWNSMPKSAVVTGLSGSLLWTGDGGHVERHLAVGDKLFGGTIEGMTPDSWFELTFKDGSTVMISGHSMLTWSDDVQKQLRLKEGSFSASVKPQPPGSPMLIHTRSTVLEVVGTRFTVDAKLSSTVLNVSEGTVQATRLSDGQTVEVSANHRVVAAMDRRFVAEETPPSVDQWNSQLAAGPEGLYGDWIASSGESGSLLRAIPYTTEQQATIYAAGIGVSMGDRPPVMLRSDSLLRFHGCLDSQHYVFFGVTLRHPNGDFAGRYQSVRPADEFGTSSTFKAVIAARDLVLDPSLGHIKNKLPATPFDLVIESVWCHTLYDPSGLGISSVDVLTVGQAKADQSAD